MSLAALSASCAGGGEDFPVGFLPIDFLPIGAAHAADGGSNPGVPDPLSGPSAGIARCPEPADGVQFDSKRGFVFDARVQEAAMSRWLSHLRCLAEVEPTERDSTVDAAARLHMRYAVANASNAHHQQPDRPGFVGVTTGDRLRATGFDAAAWGEVLSRTGPIAKEAVDGLTAAVYHRFVMLAPHFDQTGVALGLAPDGMMVAVANYGRQTDPQPGDRLVTFPATGQSNVPMAFNTDHELPDPEPTLSVVGYPVTVQSDRGTTLSVERFTLQRVRDGARVSSIVRGSGAQHDAQLSPHEAFLMPRRALEPDTEYEAGFTGRIDGVPTGRTWRFRTRPAQPLAQPAKTDLSRSEYVRVRLAGCGAQYTWSYTPNLEVELYTGSWMQVKGVTPGSGFVELRDSCGRSQRVSFLVR